MSRRARHHASPIDTSNVVPVRKHENHAVNTPPTPSRTHPQEPLLLVTLFPNLSVAVSDSTCDFVYKPVTGITRLFRDLPFHFNPPSPIFVTILGELTLSWKFHFRNDMHIPFVPERCVVRSPGSSVVFIHSEYISNCFTLELVF